MIIPMLEAVSSMISETEKESPSIDAVRCAKLMLDKIIEGMKEQDTSSTVYSAPSSLSLDDTHLSTPVKQVASPKSTPTTIKVPLPEIEYDSAQKKFLRVKNIPEDGMVVINKRRVKAIEIIGKSIPEVEQMGTPV